MAKDREPQSIQSQAYTFPYHHLPHFNSHGGISTLKNWTYGIKYMLYLLQVKNEIESLRPKTLLDVGCGDGRLLSLVDHRIDGLGLDLDDRAISFAQTLVPEQKFKSENVENVNEKFDVVTSIEVLEHIPEEKLGNFIRALGARCCNGGNLIVTVPSDNIPVRPKHYRHYNKSRLKEHLSPLMDDFKILDIKYLVQESFLLNLYEKLFYNQHWTVEIKWLTRWLWKYLWRNKQFASPDNCAVIEIILEKSAGTTYNHR